MPAGLRIHAIDFERLSHMVLLALYDRYVNSDEEFVEIEMLKKMVGYAGLNAIRDVLRDLVHDESVMRGIQRVPVQHGLLGLTGGKLEYENVPANAYRITRTGAEYLLSLGSSYIDSLSENLTLATYQKTQSPAPPNDQWEPLPIDRSTPEFAQAVRATEEAIERIEADNGYAATEPEERNGLVASMRGALNSMRVGWSSRQAILSGLVFPLRYIIEKFSGAGIAEMAKHAVTALLRLIS